MGRQRTLSTDQVLKAIHQWICEHGHPPTIEELRRVLNVGSGRTIQRYLDELERGGAIERNPGARGIRLRRFPVEEALTAAVPLVGEVTAGPLSQAEEMIETWVRLPAKFLKPRSQQHFLLRIRGNSMNRARIEGQTIEAGDLALVRQQPQARPGDVVVALVDGETTVKRLALGEGYAVLKPESTEKRYQPIIVNRDFSVQGVVTKIFKRGAELLSPKGD